MKPVLAILAHESAQPTIDDFLPRWKQVDARLICYTPIGHNVIGFDETRTLGESAHSGYQVFSRFVETLKDLLTLDREWFVVAEYDTVNLRPDLPRMIAGRLTSHLVMAPPHDCASGQMQLCSLSPWIMDRKTMALFVFESERLLVDDPNCHRASGLLDRWIGTVIQKGEIPAQGGTDLLGYPWHPGAHRRIRSMGYNWVHGWKRKEDFLDLWNKTV